MLCRQELLRTAARQGAGSCRRPPAHHDGWVGAGGAAGQVAKEWAGDGQVALGAAACTQLGKKLAWSLSAAGAPWGPAAQRSRNCRGCSCVPAAHRRGQPPERAAGACRGRRRTRRRTAPGGGGCGDSLSGPARPPDGAAAGAAAARAGGRQALHCAPCAPPRLHAHAAVAGLAVGKHGGAHAHVALLRGRVRRDADVALNRKGCGRSSSHRWQAGGRPTWKVGATKPRPQPSGAAP